MKPPADAVIVLRCGKCTKVAGWVQRLKGELVLTRLGIVPTSAFGDEPRAIGPQHPLPMDERLVEINRWQQDGNTDVIVRCTNKHLGAVEITALLDAKPTADGKAAVVSTTPIRMPVRSHKQSP